MLVLRRKQGEKIVINDNITLTILKTSPTNVQIGIDAPRDIRIIREEKVNDAKQ